MNFLNATSTICVADSATQAISEGARFEVAGVAPGRSPATRIFDIIVRKISLSYS
jgi:hypothetical protein